MIFSEEMGILIDETLKDIMEKAVKIDGNSSQLAKAIGKKTQTVRNWLGKSNQIGEFIVWDSWKPLRDHLAVIGLINSNDPKWMLPSELRELVKSKTSSGLSDDEKTMLSFFRTLNDDGKRAAINNVKGLAVIPSLSNSGLNGDKAV